MRILCASDIHLGRIPSLPSHPRGGYNHRTAWDFVVRTALDECPDLVLLAGDIIEADNRFLETSQPLRDGILTLLQAGISVMAVAGNHDSEVFPELHASLARESDLPRGATFHLLGLTGSGGRNTSAWTEDLFIRGADSVRIMGWSFSSRICRTSSLSGFPPVDTSVPVLGLLHGDLDVPDSSYGPLRRQELVALPVTRWVLGHIHAPTGADGEKQFYCGSPFPLRTTERGAHGCWMLEVRGQTLGAPTLIPCPVRVDALDVPLAAGDGTPAALPARIQARIQQHIRTIQVDNPQLTTLFLRLRLTGHCDAGQALAELEGELEQWREIEGVDVTFVGKVINACAPEIRLEDWQDRQDACGRIARMVLNLQRGLVDTEAEALIRQILDADQITRSLSIYTEIKESQRDPALAGPDWAREVLLTASWDILGQIKAQEAAHV